jgi:hypothetical protein
MWWAWHVVGGVEKRNAYTLIVRRVHRMAPLAIPRHNGGSNIKLRLK